MKVYNDLAANIREDNDELWVDFLKLPFQLMNAAYDLT